MKTIMKILGVAILLLTLSFTANDKKVVVIDAGHGGKDNGNVTQGINEKDIVTDIANKVRELNKNENVEIVLLRESDEFIGLEDRTARINELKPDLLISLHINSSINPEVNGVEIYVSPKSTQYRESLEEAEKLNASFKSSNLKPLGIKEANFSVLKDTNIPAVLVEMGFLSNEGDRSLLMSEEGQMAIAKSLLHFIY